MTMMGFFRLRGTIRPDLKETISALKESGINVRIITGNDVSSTKEFAIDAGLISESEREDSNVVKTGFEIVD